jgi:uncharacterized protein YciI
MKYLLSYESAEGMMPRAMELFEEHRAFWKGFLADRTLLLIGPMSDPSEGALAVFTTREAAEAFAAGDPFVTGGVVARWRIQEWNEVLLDPL